MKKLLNFTTFLLMWCILHTSVVTAADLTVKADVLNSNTPSRTKIDVKKNLDLQTTGGLYLPSGTTAQQPVPYKDGMFRYNSTEGTAELFANGLWGPVGGSTSIADWNAGNDYETGDFVIQSLKLYRALLDHTASGSFPTDLANGDWEEISAGITSTGTIADNRIARFDGTTGELIQSSTAVLDDSGNLSGINNIGVAGNASVAGTTTLNTSLTGVVKAVSGLLSASAVDLSLDVVGTLPINNGGTGSTSKSWVDLTTNQGAIAGDKAFTGNLSTSGTMLASNLSGTNTGDLITRGATGSTTVTNTLKTPFRQVTPTATGVVDIETGNSNVLINPRFEHTTYNTGWTCSLGTMSQGAGPDGSKALSVVSTGGGFRCRQTFTSSADLKGTLARFYARVKTAAPDVKVCGLDGGILTANEVGCVTVNPTNANKVFDDPSGFFRYGDTLYGIVIYTNNAAVFPTVIDEVSMGAAGLTTATIQGNTVYSARLITSTASGGLTGVTPSNSNWISGCTNANPTVCTLTGFTSAPNCVASNTTGTSHTAAISGPSANSVTISTFNTATNVLASPVGFTIYCEKSGADYANSSSSGILSSNADFGPISITPTLANSGNATVTATISRTRTTATVSGRIVIGATLPTGTIQLIVPSIYSSVKTNNFLLSDATAFVGVTGFYSGTAATINATTFQFYGASAVANPWSGTVPGTFAAGNYIEFNISYDVVGWTQSPIAIIPLAGTATTPGYTRQVDDLVFSFGGTSLANNCTASPCFLSQDGNGISTVTRAGTGDYLANFPKLYKSVRCGSSMYILGTGPGTISGLGQCTNCSSLNFGTRLTTSGVLTDGSGTLVCKGYY